jgi:hypothetical protein
MSLPAQGLLRGLRAASLEVAGLVLALVAHLGAGALVPGLVLLLVLAGLTAAASELFTSVKRGPRRGVMDCDAGGSSCGLHG